MFLAVLKESYGWPLFLALGWGAVSNRRWVPLLGLASGVILLGAMNSREARYALPLLFLLAAAGAPAARATRGFRLSFALAAALTFLGSARVYAGSSASETPSIRVLQFDSTSLYRWGAWPGIPEAFRPISYDLESWRVTEVVNAMARITDVGDVVTFVSAPGNFGAPESSVYLLASEEIGLGLHFQTVHLAQGARGLMVQSYLAPFVVQGAPASRVVYAVTNGNDLVETWLGSSEARLVASFPLPDGTEGRLGQVQVGVVGGGSRTPMP
jgi:hypothetical protein